MINYQSLYQIYANLFSDYQLPKIIGKQNIRKSINETRLDIEKTNDTENKMNLTRSLKNKQQALGKLSQLFSRQVRSQNKKQESDRLNQESLKRIFENEDAYQNGSITEAKLGQIEGEHADYRQASRKEAVRSSLITSYFQKQSLAIGRFLTAFRKFKLVSKIISIVKPVIRLASHIAVPGSGEAVNTVAQVPLQAISGLVQSGYSDNMKQAQLEKRNVENAIQEQQKELNEEIVRDQKKIG